MVADMWWSLLVGLFLVSQWFVYGQVWPQTRHGMWYRILSVPIPLHSTPVYVRDRLMSGLLRSTQTHCLRTIYTPSPQSSPPLSCSSRDEAAAAEQLIVLRPC